MLKSGGLEVSFPKWEILIDNGIILFVLCFVSHRVRRPRLPPRQQNVSLRYTRLMVIRLLRMELFVYWERTVSNEGMLTVFLHDTIWFLL